MWPWRGSPIRCPRCKSDQPAFELLHLRRFYVEAGRFVSRIEGAKVACQARGCGAIYCVGPDGVFAHNKQAPPYPEAGPAPPEPDDPPADDFEPPEPPEPLSRSSV